MRSAFNRLLGRRKNEIGGCTPLDTNVSDDTPLIDAVEWQGYDPEMVRTSRNQLNHLMLRIRTVKASIDSKCHKIVTSMPEKDWHGDTLLTYKSLLVDVASCMYHCLATPH